MSGFPIPAIGVEFVSTPNPHYIPGYTGHCPELRLRIGQSYGTQSHKLFLDPGVPHSKKLVLSDRTVYDYRMHKTAKCDVDNMNAKLGFPVKPCDSSGVLNDQMKKDSAKSADQPTDDEIKKLRITDPMVLCDHLIRPKKDLELDGEKSHKGLDVGISKIYHTTIGQLPNYAGHIPGEKFRFGKTYGCTTIDGKRYLRGDLT